MTLNYHLMGAPIWRKDPLCPALVCKRGGDMGTVTVKQAKREVEPGIQAQREKLAKGVGRPVVGPVADR